MRRALGVAALAALAVTVLAACSSSDSATPATTTLDRATSTTTTAPAFNPADVGRARLTPATGGNGHPTLGPGGLDLASVGYTESEYYLDGRATSYAAVGPLRESGRWTVEPGTEATYRTRVVVRRPKDAAAFNGSVAVEWFNVSGGLDAAPDWTFAHVELIRSGWAWVGVSAQKIGIDGGGGPGAILALKTADKARYGSLDHPGDQYSYDIFSQAGAAVRTQAKQLLGGLAPERVFAIGESQSAFRLTTYANAIQPRTNLFDGFLIHSRGGSAAPLGADETDDAPPTPTFIRTDLDVPVLVLATESDLPTDGGLGYEAARQQDTDRFRTWEIAGTAHIDAYGLGIGDTDDGSGAADEAAFAAMLAPPAKVYGGVITCDAPINTGPQTYVVRAAMAALDAWVRRGTLPASTRRLLLDDTRAAYQRDETGNAVDGVRTPHVDAPVAVLSGLGQTGASFCSLFGTTKPLDAAGFAAANVDRATWLRDWNDSVDSAVRAHTLLRVDGDRLKAVAAKAATPS